MAANQWPFIFADSFREPMVAMTLEDEAVIMPCMVKIGTIRDLVVSLCRRMIDPSTWQSSWNGPHDSYRSIQVRGMVLAPTRLNSGYVGRRYWSGLRNMFNIPWYLPVQPALDGTGIIYSSNMMGRAISKPKSNMSRWSETLMIMPRRGSCARKPLRFFSGYSPKKNDYFSLIISIIGSYFAQFSKLFNFFLLSGDIDYGIGIML